MRAEVLPMFIIKNSGITDPALNLALEEHCYRCLEPRHDYVLFYINRPSIILGNHQNPFQEVNFIVAEQKQIRPLRRISGGGTVYHDPGNLNFSFITGFNEEMLDYFKKLLQPILDTLHHLGVPAKLTAKNNIIVDGRKVSGNSQHTNMRRMLSHGTLLFDADLDILQQVLQSNLHVIQSRAVASLPSNVTNISDYLSRPMEIEAFMAELIVGISNRFGELKEYQPTAADWDSVCRLSEEKYRSWEWTIGHTPEFTVAHKVQFDSKIVKALITVKHGIIKTIKFPQNNLDLQATSQVTDGLIGKRYKTRETDHLLL
jgi:lipoate-protein ligase A